MTTYELLPWLIIWFLCAIGGWALGAFIIKKILDYLDTCRHRRAINRKIGKIWDDAP